MIKTTQDSAARQFLMLNDSQHVTLSYDDLFIINMKRFIIIFKV